MYLLFLLVSPFHKKAKKWIKGRENYFQKLETNVPSKQGKRLWVHCASLGEFEQARPIIERWLKENDNWTLVLTFFSPSGYEIRKNYENAEWVGYMALDTKTNAKKFMDTIRPDMVLFVKYEFWYFHLTEVIRRKIPIYLVSATFREGHYILKSIGAKTRNILKQFNHIFLQEEQSLNRLKKKGFNNISISGDTRFDRVMAQVALDEDVPNIKEWKGNNKTIILGSSWKEEEELMASFLPVNKEYKVIIAPHDIGHLEKIENLFSFTTCSRYSEINTSSQVLIVDSIGLLSKLYKYGDIAIIGGGYGRGLHNILEPLAFGLSTFFGPVHDKFPEAKQAIKAGVGFELKGDFKVSESLPSKMRIKNYMQEHSGATNKVLGFIEDQR
jgi:3-deoxy-D-manno-octulosonic-acid transferase